MQITTSHILSSNSATSPNDSLWNTILSNWTNDLANLANNPSLQQNLLGQIEALAGIAEQPGSSAVFANLFRKLVNDYNAFLQDPSKVNLGIITTDISNLTANAPQTLLNYNQILAQSCELLLYKINLFNPTHNQDEIAGLMSAIEAFTPPTFQSTMSLVQSNYEQYLKSGNQMYFYWAQNDLNSLITMLRAS